MEEFFARLRAARLTSSALVCVATTSLTPCVTMAAATPATNAPNAQCVGHAIRPVVIADTTGHRIATIQALCAGMQQTANVHDTERSIAL